MGVSAKGKVGAGVVGAFLAVAVWLFGPPPARAGVRPAADPIVSKRLQRIVEMIPDAPLDLPPYLAKPQDVYLLVTAGASYTDIQVLANPEVAPQTVAQALSSALAGTPLAGRTVEWSADRYAAAQVSEHHSRFGVVRGSNTVLLTPLAAGLRQAGLTPHLLLRVPVHDRTPPLPLSRYGTKTFRWYDAKHLGNQSSVTVTARITWISLARIMAYYLLIPIFGLLGLWLAGFVSSRGQKDDAARRQVFRSISTIAVTVGLLAQVGGLVYLLRTPTPAAIADLWFGSSSTTILVPYLTAGIAPLMLFLLLARRQEIRRFGPVPTGPAIPMSDEEKAVRQRVARWSALPHVLGAGVLAVALLAVPRSSPLYSFVHPVAVALPAVAGLLASKVFSKRLDRFTQKTLDDALTWRARQLGQTLGVRMPDVFVEDSSRAAHLAFAAHQGHHITLSRKLQETFTPAEMDFVLAHHLACMKRRTTPGNEGKIVWILLLLTATIVPFVWSRFVSGAPILTAFVISAWFYPVLILYALLWASSLLMFSNGTASETSRDIEADRDALEATGNLVAAQSALDKLGADALSPDAQLAMQLNSYLAGNSRKSVTQLAAARLMSRQAALQKTAQALGQAPQSPP